MTWSSPTSARISSTCSSMNCRAVQVGGAWQTSSTKLPSISVPRGVCPTSGWNWTPYRARSRCSMAATGVVSVEAVTAKPEGGRSTESRWLIQAVCSAGRSPKMALPSASRSGVLPNSPMPVFETSPPSAAAIACMP